MTFDLSPSPSPSVAWLLLAFALLFLTYRCLLEAARPRSAPRTPRTPRTPRRARSIRSAPDPERLFYLALALASLSGVLASAYLAAAAVPAAVQ